ncbi:MAG: chorismate mutase, partial [Paenibacillus sp. RIFOXYA1_FULL_44_5]
MSSKELENLREQVDVVNQQLLELLNRRAALSQQIGKQKEKQGVPKFDPIREKLMLDQLSEMNQGPFDDQTIKHIFKEIFKASLQLQKNDLQEHLLVSRKRKNEDTVIEIQDVKIGGGAHTLIAGPCSVESYDQLRKVAAVLKENGIRVIRGGAFKPRTSPYDFQGLGIEGLKMLKEVADEYGLITISEIVNPVHMELAEQYLDIIQIGARNMQNFELL